MPEDSWELEDWRKHGTNLEASRGEEGRGRELISQWPRIPLSQTAWGSRSL